MLGPGFKGVGDRFDDMIRGLSANATKYGFLSSSAWISACDHTTSNEYMSIIYFENELHLHEYAYGPLHVKAMQWWREVEKKIPHVGIMHEVFACPEQVWEGIYINYQPVGLEATTKQITRCAGLKEWVNPLVKIGGKLLYSKGRMGRGYSDKEYESL